MIFFRKRENRTRVVSLRRIILVIQKPVPAQTCFLRLWRNKKNNFSTFSSVECFLSLSRSPMLQKRQKQQQQPHFACSVPHRQRRRRRRHELPPVGVTGFHEPSGVGRYRRLPGALVLLPSCSRPSPDDRCSQSRNQQGQLLPGVRGQKERPPPTHMISHHPFEKYRRLIDHKWGLRSRA